MIRWGGVAWMCGRGVRYTSDCADINVTLHTCADALPLYMLIMNQSIRFLIHGFCATIAALPIPSVATEYAFGAMRLNGICDM